MPDESEDAGLELQKQSSADAETAEAGYRKTAKRILCLVLAIPVSAAGVWLLQQGAGYQGGSLLIGLGIQAAAGIVFVGALVLVAIGLLGPKASIPLKRRRNAGGCRPIRRPIRTAV